MRKQTSHDGFTLLEVVIITALIVPVLGIVLSSMDATAESASGATLKVNAQRQKIFAIRKLRKEFRVARVTGVSPDGLSVTYQRPVDVNGSGLPLDALGDITWGAMEAGGPVAGSSYTMTFVGEANVSEAAMGIDLNQDGDTADTFLRGYLQRSTAEGLVQRFSPSAFLVDAADPTGDRDGDGNPDPVFTWQEGEPLVLSLLVLAPNPGARVQSDFSRISIHLMNMGIGNG